MTETEGRVDSMEDWKRKHRETCSGSGIMEGQKRRNSGGECMGDQKGRKTYRECMEAYVKAGKEEQKALQEQMQQALREELQQRQELSRRGEREWHAELARQIEGVVQKQRGEQVRKERVEEQRWREEQLRVEQLKWREDQQRIEQEWQAGRKRRGEHISQNGQNENVDRKRKNTSDENLETSKRRRTSAEVAYQIGYQRWLREQEEQNWREEQHRNQFQNWREAQQELRTANLESDAEFAYQLQLTEALNASRELAGLATGSNSRRTGDKKAIVPNARKIQPKLEKDHSQEADCLICYERVLTADMFVLKGCLHKFCSACLSQYVTVRVRANQVPVKCPRECSQQITLDQARPFLDPAVVESFQKRLMEAIIPVSQRVYCPLPKCSALMSKSDRTLIVNGSSSSDLHELFGRCRCVECRHSFCMECRVSWHKRMTCADYQKLPPDQRNPEDAQFHRVAGEKKWQQCKKCRSVISLNKGCNHITCRCGHQFCYLCGADYKNKSATCKCALWDERNLRF